MQGARTPHVICIVWWCSARQPEQWLTVANSALNAYSCTIRVLQCLRSLAVQAYQEAWEAERRLRFPQYASMWTLGQVQHHMGASAEHKETQ